MGGILHVKCALRQASERVLDAVVVDFFWGDLNLGGGVCGWVMMTWSGDLYCENGWRIVGVEDQLRVVGVSRVVGLRVLDGAC